MRTPELLAAHLETGLEEVERGAKTGGGPGDSTFVVHGDSESTLAAPSDGIFLTLAKYVGGNWCRLIGVDCRCDDGSGAPDNA